MFSNLIYFILVILLINFTPLTLHGDASQWTPLFRFGLGIFLYLILLGVIILQNKFLRLSKNTLLKVFICEFFFYLSITDYVLESHRIFSSYFLITTFYITLYFVASFVFHRGFNTAKQAINEICLLLPFSLLFFLTALFIDCFSRSFQSSTTFFLAFMSTFATFMLFFPWFMQRFWQCSPLDNPLLQRLERLCERANFRHAGLKVWTIMNHYSTAAIIGVIPRFRYVMFTKSLLDGLSPEALEAVLAHEIGHSYRRHLLIYPFIFAGMLMIPMLGFPMFFKMLQEFFHLIDPLFPPSVLKGLYSLSFFIPFAITFLLYFRFVFGHFSRLFERQADLHIFALGCRPSSMILALDELGRITGDTHKTPNWHHYSIYQRMEFLSTAEKDPTLIANHHKKVKIHVSLFFAILLLFVSLMIVLT